MAAWLSHIIAMYVLFFVPPIQVKLSTPLDSIDFRLEDNHVFYYEWEKQKLSLTYTLWRF